MNYQSTSNASGIIQAPKEARYFIQRMSRQGKSEGRWIYITPLTKGQGFRAKEMADDECDWKNSLSQDSRFRVQLAEVFI